MDEDMQKRLDAMTPDERRELESFVRRFHQQLDIKLAQLRHETEDAGRLSDEDLEMRSQLRTGCVPLISDDGELIYRKRQHLTIEDMRRFARFMDVDAERRKREIGDLADESEN
jgi:hypothetical protein